MNTAMVDWIVGMFDLREAANEHETMFIQIFANFLKGFTFFGLGG